MIEDSFVVGDTAEYSGYVGATVVRCGEGLGLNTMMREFPTGVLFLAGRRTHNTDRRSIHNAKYPGKVRKRVLTENVIERLRDEIFEGSR
jgi:hypothetical protein